MKFISCFISQSYIWSVEFLRVPVQIHFITIFALFLQKDEVTTQSLVKTAPLEGTELDLINKSKQKILQASNCSKSADNQPYGRSKKRDWWILQDSSAQVEKRKFVQYIFSCINRSFTETIAPEESLTFFCPTSKKLKKRIKKRKIRFDRIYALFKPGWKKFDSCLIFIVWKYWWALELVKQI